MFGELSPTIQKSKLYIFERDLSADLYVELLLSTFFLNFVDVDRNEFQQDNDPKYTSKL
jgi:hypothetical protein